MLKENIQFSEKRQINHFNEHGKRDSIPIAMNEKHKHLRLFHAVVRLFIGFENGE